MAFGRAAAVSEGWSSTATSPQKLGLAFSLAFSLFSPAHARDQLGTDAVVALAAVPDEASQARSYYREYNVPTPGSRERGARHIVCGGYAARAPDTCYYSADHYASFERIVH